MLSTEQRRGEATTTPRQDLITALLGSWMTIGGFVDGFAHRNLEAPETFFTPWHAVLYSGYLASVLWITWLVMQNQPDAGSLREAIPRGYRTAVAGLVLFAAGGVGDLIWHTVFGIEVSIEALLSPTHIVLLLGSILILAGPLLARRWDDDYRPDRTVTLMPALIPITAAAAELGFFFQYIDGLSARFMQFEYLPGPETGYFELVAGITSMLVTTAILVGALLLLMRRWDPPPGSALFLFVVYGVLMELLEGFEFPEDVIAPLAGGLAAELLLRAIKPNQRWGLRLRLFAFTVPLVMWAARFGVVEYFTDINWPVSVWTGALVFTGLAGVGLSLLSEPPSRPQLTA